MKVLKVDPIAPEEAAIMAAAEVLRGGGLVAMPTETVYGLAANALDRIAIARIYAAKDRPSYNPLIAHCRDAEAAAQLAANWSPTASMLAEHFWPGPLTLVVPKEFAVPDELTAGLPTVAVRVPRHPVAQALLRAVPFPLAAPSANPFTQLSPTDSAHVLKGLAGRVDLVLDAGPSDYGIESTVVDVSGDTPRLLRPGSISLSEIEVVLGHQLAATQTLAGDSPRPGPGMIARHYSPRATLSIVDSGDLEQFARSLGREKQVVGALLISQPIPREVKHPIQMPSAAEGYAARLYAALHQLDDAGCDRILVERPPDEPAWVAITDRLDRASR